MLSSIHWEALRVVDVFISYSRTDKEQVARLAQSIQDEGYSVWWDAELPPHQSYGEVITEKIESAKAAVVVWSPKAAASEWVRAEADTARNQKKLIQTALGDIMPPLPFNQIQYADLGDWLGEPDHPGWRRVKESLRMLCGEREGEPGIDRPAASVAAARTPVSSPPPPHARSSTPSHGTPSKSSANWPVLVGAAIGILGLAAGAWMAFGGGPQESGQTEIATLTSDAGPLNTPAAPQGNIADSNEASVNIPEASPSQPPAGDAYNREVSLVNKSGQAILFLYWSNTEAEGWGDDKLGSNNVLMGGNSLEVTVDDGSGACEFDFKAELADDQEVVLAAVNVCEEYEITFNAP